MRRTRGLLLVFLLVALACRQNQNGTTTTGGASPASGKPTKGVVSGTVAYANGKALQGATLEIAGKEYAASVTATSKADGSYTMRIGNQQSNYSLSGWIEKQFNGVNFRFPLQPQGEGTEFFGEEGFVKNFIWRTSGRAWWKVTDPEDPQSFVGITFDVQGYDPKNDPGGTEPLAAQPGSKIKVTFEPNGPLIDGSTGKTVTEELEIGNAGIARYSGKVGLIKDVPVGNYKITARLVGSDGSTKDLQVSYRCSRGRPSCDSNATDFASPADFKAAADQSTVHSRPYQHPPASGVLLYVYAR
jgi:hypothetical protein